MKLFRRIIFWCHLLAGTFAGLVVLVMSVTGVLLTYEKQLTAWADARGVRVAPPSPTAARLPLDNIVAAARHRKPDAAPSTVTVRSDANAAASVGYGREGVVLVNPYTAEVVGEGSRGARNFFRVVTDWHRWLGAGGEGRTVARAVTGACNLAFLFLVVSGFYLWFPRVWTRKQFRNVAWFRRGLRGRSRDFNWHNVVGLWAFVPLFVVVLSAVPISYSWASDLVYRLAGDTPPAPRPAAPQGQPPAGAQTPNNQTPAPSLDGLDPLLARAATQTSDWRSITLQIPTKPDAPVAFTLDAGEGGQPQKRAQLTLDRASGEVVRWEPFQSQTPGRRLRSYLRFAHTGEVFGLVGQTVAGLASLGGAWLVYTGLSLAWRRFRAWSARRAERTAPAGASDASVLSGASPD